MFPFHGVYFGRNHTQRNASVLRNRVLQSNGQLNFLSTMFEKRKEPRVQQDEVISYLCQDHWIEAQQPIGLESRGRPSKQVVVGGAAQQKSSVLIQSKQLVVRPTHF